MNIPQNHTMKTYLVGGAIRDFVFNRSIAEKDWLVVGASVQQMLDWGFIPVKQHIPVFRHPKTQEVYALARTERKIAAGYHGFEFIANPTVTLEEDLARRDLTINAMALEISPHEPLQEKHLTQIIDPYKGSHDLSAKILRHISSTFQEDPLRVLRLARFYGKLPDFTIAPDTLELVQRVVDSHELEALAPERVWVEIYKGLKLTHTSRMWLCLEKYNILKKIWPEFTTLLVPSLSMVDKLHLQNNSCYLKWAILASHLPPELLSSQMLDHKIPQKFQYVADKVARFRQILWRLPTSMEEVLDTWNACGGLRQADLVQGVLDCAQAINRPSSGAYAHWQTLWHILQNINYQSLVQEGLELGYVGKDLPPFIRQKQLQALLGSTRGR
ncbi:MAG: hypothetical protein QM520_05365, partial [Gammaproteobacteria bacterium]|nr:hypothetical protein [Gammaproteobacteria bacterium]